MHQEIKIKLFQAITDALHMYELLAYNEILFEFSVLFCTASIELQNICIGILYFIGGLDLEKFDGVIYIKLKEKL